MSFQTFSQAGQDEWVFSLFGNKGTFLDVGCGHPEAGSNTCALERIGWTGFLLDLHLPNVIACRETRSSPVLHADATVINWTEVLPFKAFDYLSLDVDEAQWDALANLLGHGVTFKAATVEHDAYRFGNDRRDELRRLMTLHGYELARPDVECGGVAFEDWWVKKQIDKP